jgi:hypothetical protein
MPKRLREIAVVGREVISRSSRSGQIEGENEMEFQKFLVFDKAYLIAPIRLSFGMSRSSLDLFFLEIIGDKDSPVRFEEKLLLSGMRVCVGLAWNVLS